MSKPKELTPDDMQRAVQTAIDCADSQRALAKAWGVSPGYLTDLRLGRRLPGPSVLKHFGLKRVVVTRYVADESAKDFPRVGGPEGGAK